MIAIVDLCTSCDALLTRIAGHSALPKIVPGTGRLDCGHMDIESLSEVHVPQIVHLALSTLLRRPEMLADRDAAHTIQEWLKVPANMRRTAALPWVLASGYDVTSEGLATARILARTMSAIAAPSDAFYWKAAANIMRVRML